MSNTSFKKYLEEKIKSNPGLKRELEKVDRAVEIAYQIYSLRKKKGLTQSQLAKSIGVSQSNIARIESADYNHYTIRTLRKVAEGLGAYLNIFINSPQQTHKIISTIKSSPTFQKFIYARIAGEYFVSGIKTINKEETVTFGDIAGAERIQVLAGSKMSGVDINKPYYLTL